MNRATEMHFVQSPTRPPNRFTSWGGWLLFSLLCGHLIFCHGCHPHDSDDELCFPARLEPEHKSGQSVQENTPGFPGVQSVSTH
jgi:hypothetical protein